jgi:hypothetical protein
MNRKTAAVPLIVLVLLAVSWGDPAAQPSVWTEHFDTRTFLNPAQTNALVDTVASVATLYPFRMGPAGNAVMPGYAFDVAIAGDYAFVAGVDSGLSVFDISNPESPVYVTTPDPFSAYGVVVDGDYAYAVGEVDFMVVFDISDPSAPTSVGGYDTGGYSYGIDVDGDVVYVAVIDSGLVAIDVTDPTNPQKLWTYRSPGAEFGSVDAEGIVVYATDFNGGLEAIDLSDPSGPQGLDYVDLPGDPFRVEVDGPVAYVANMTEGLQVVLVAAPWALQLLETVTVASGALGVTVDGNVPYVSAPDDGFYAVRFDENFSFSVFDSVETVAAPLSAAIAGDYAFVAADDAGLHAVNIAAPLSPPLPGPNIDTPGGVGGIQADGVFLYVADGFAGLQIYEIFDPTAPLLVGNYDTSDACTDVKVVGPLAFVADRLDGMHVIDVTDYENPSLLGSGYDTASEARAIDVAGKYAYIADRDDGLVVLDISNVETPSLAGSYDTPDMATDVEVHGNHAYVADLQGGLQIVDVSDPTNPTLAGAYDRPGAFAVGLTVSGDYCYVGNDAGGVQIIDVSDPTSPSLVATYDTPGLARDAVVSGNRLFVTDHTGGTLALDVTVPSSPQYRGTIATSQYARYLDVSGEYLYVSNATDGFQVAQVFDRTSNLDDNVVQSVVRDTPRLVSHVSLSVAYNDSVRVEVSADSGTTWDEIVPDQTWQPLSKYGTQLMWRANLHATAAGMIPVCDSLVLTYDDLVPIVLQEIRADASDGGVVLRWDLAADEAVSGFRVYRCEAAGGSSEVAVHDGLLPPESRSFSDRTAVAGREYSYTLGVVKPDGSEVRSRSVSILPKPVEAALYQNHPNPFNPTTTISFAVPRAMRVELAIYSPSGQLVRRLIDGPVAAGLRDVEWDGTNQKGQRVASGVYFYRFTAGKFTQTRKMILLK